MKISICLILFLMPLTLYSGEGIVVAFKAPIFKRKSFTAEVAQWKKKGETVYIHNIHIMSPETIELLKQVNLKEKRNIDKDLLESNVQSSDLDIIDEKIKKSKIARIKNAADRSDFYITLDRNGRVGYIPKQFVKLIYNTNQENQFPVGSLENDITDYRLSKKELENYPYFKSEPYRVQVLLGSGESEKSNYNYSQKISGENLERPKILKASVLKQANFKIDPNLFLGGSVILKSWQSTFTLEDRSVDSKEDFLYWSLGPQILYDYYLSKNHESSIYSGILFNFSNIKVTQESVNNNSLESRIFRGKSFALEIGMQYRNLSLGENVEVVLDGQFLVELPHNLKTTDNPNDSSIWQAEESNVYSKKLTTSFNLFLGIQTSF